MCVCECVSVMLVVSCWLKRQSKRFQIVLFFTDASAQVSSLFSPSVCDSQSPQVARESWKLGVVWKKQNKLVKMNVWKQRSTTVGDWSFPGSHWDQTAWDVNYAKP